MAPRLARPARVVDRGGRDALKAFALAVVLGVHALLLTVRLPRGEPPHGMPPRAPITVRLLVPPLLPRPPSPASRRPPEAARSRLAAPAASRPERMPVDPQPGPPSAAPASEPPAASAEPAARPPLLQGRDLARPAPPPTLAERARARSGEAPRETPLQRGMARSARQDCEHAYAGLGLFAIPALLRDSLREDGCRW